MICKFFGFKFIVWNIVPKKFELWRSLLENVLSFIYPQYMQILFIQYARILVVLVDEQIH